MPALKEIKLLVYAENTVWEDANLNCSPDLQKLVSEKYGAILEGLEGLPMVIELGLGEVEMGERAAVTHVQTFKDCFDQMLVNREWKARLAAAEGLVALSFGTRFHGPHGCLELDSGME